MIPAFRPDSVAICALWILAGVGPAAPALAQDALPAVAATATQPTAATPDIAPADQAAPERFAIHGQSTLTVQGTPGFAVPYSGANSLAPNQVKETFDVTAFLGVRLWQGAELWINPEIDQGFGLSDTLGIAGFPSGEAYKVGKANPYFKLDRVFLRQTISTGGDTGTVDPAANQLGGRRRADRLVLTLGKFSVVDVFDTNAYAHDPRGDFLNWALIDTGTFDYAANSWGYTYGGAAEWYQGRWTLRAGLFDLSKVPNQPALEIGFAQYQADGEVEHRHTMGGHPGAVRVGFFFTRGLLTGLADAVALYNAAGAIPENLASLRHYRDKWGIQLNAEQAVSASIGLFLRAGYGDGKSEADDFTDIDRTLAVGGQLKGSVWGRADDRVGLAGIVNGVSRLHQHFSKTVALARWSAMARCRTPALSGSPKATTTGSLPARSMSPLIISSSPTPATTAIAAPRIFSPCASTWGFRIDPPGG